MIKIAKQVVSFTGVFASIILFMLTSLVVHCFVWSRWARLKLVTRVCRFYCRIILFLVGIRTHVNGAKNLSGRGNLFVSNHLSYLDVLIIGAHKPCCFVTSVEIKETPFLGQICQLAGCLFVERRSGATLKKEIREVTEALTQGLDVVIFPEATSSNGEQILRFRRPLYNAAIESQGQVIPLCLNYHSLNGQPLNYLNRDLVFWYGDMAFASHLWAAVGIGKIDVELTVLSAISAASKDAKELAAYTQELVAEKFSPVLMPCNSTS